MNTQVSRDIALWATNLGFRVGSVGDWAAVVEERVARAAEEGAGLLLMPEYVAETWLSFKPEGLEPTGEMDFLASHAPEAVDLLARMAARHAVAISAGSMPWRTPARHHRQPRLDADAGRAPTVAGQAGADARAKRTPKAGC